MNSAAQPAPDQATATLERARRATARKGLILSAVIVLCSIPFFRSFEARDRPLGEDEIYWIGQAYYFHLAFEQWDWTHPDWQLLPARENPVLGKYVIGVGLRVAGLSVAQPDWLGVFYIIAKDRPNAWGDTQDQAERRAVLERMTPATRRLALAEGRFEHPIQYATAARAVMLLFGVLAVLLVFGITALYTHPLVAFVAAVAFAMHPAVTASYTEIGVDILAIAFSLLAVLHYVGIERRIWRQSARPDLARAMVCVGGGLSVAFAFGSKMNAIIVGFVGVILLLAFSRRAFCYSEPKAKDSAATMLCLLLVSFVVFVGLNPGNYPNPIKGLRSTYTSQQRSLEVQKTIPAKRHPLRTMSERAWAMANLTALHPAGFAVIIGAFIILVVSALRSEQPMPLIPLWWLIAVVAVTAWLPFSRPRYALPVIAPGVILVASAAGALFKWFQQKRVSRSLGRRFAFGS